MTASQAPGPLRLPVVSQARRDEILGLPPTPETHDRLLAALGFADAVELTPPPAPPSAAPAELRVVAWNLERCKHVDATAALLARLRPDVALLSELDCGMARSGQLHTARALAGRLGYGYAYAVEFLELGLGDAGERERHAGQRNEIGYHGGAILSRLPLERPRVVRLERSGAWLDGARGERRVGARMALLADVALGAGRVRLAAVHLESHSDPAERTRQLCELLRALDEDGAPPALIGGDLNTFSLGAAELADRERLREAFAQDAERWTHPVPHEPLFAAARAAGYEWERCNELGTGSLRLDAGRGPFRIDWMLSRGLAAREPRVVDAVDPEGGSALSDHEALLVTVAPGAEEAR
ncbi:MAG: endonuclease/exonuclease/phosphatase family protein [Myxococcota bacterium]|nr:endonuclease/exonuclease/phosphatase family protein [Myxococcota bacterium]